MPTLLLTGLAEALAEEEDAKARFGIVGGRLLHAETQLAAAEASRKSLVRAAASRNIDTAEIAAVAASRSVAAETVAIYREATPGTERRQVEAADAVDGVLRSNLRQRAGAAKAELGEITTLALSESDIDKSVHLQTRRKAAGDKLAELTRYLNSDSPVLRRLFAGEIAAAKVALLQPAIEYDGNIPRQDRPN